MAAIVKKARECVGRGSESGHHRIALRMALHRDGRNEAVLGCDQGSRFLSWIVDAVQGLEMLLLIFVLSFTRVRNDRPRVETLTRIIVAVAMISANKGFVRGFTSPSARDT